MRERWCRSPRLSTGGDFYVICPDDTVSSELDAARILWSAGDMTENRPALSHWHPDRTQRFDAFVAQQQKK